MGEKTYTQEEVDKLLETEKAEMKKKAVDWAKEKGEELAEGMAEKKAMVLFEKDKDLTLEEKQFEIDKKQLSFYIDDKALPPDMTLGKMMMCRELGRELGLSLIQTINGIGFVNGKATVYGETYLALITKNGYKINVLEESDRKVEVELVGPNGTQKGSYTREEAQASGQWKLVFLKYPKRMLRYKAIRNAQNILCPEIMGGAYLNEEAEEIKRDTTQDIEEIQDAEVEIDLEGFEPEVKKDLTKGKE